MTANGISTGNSRPQAEAVAYRGEPLPSVPEDLVIPNVLSLDFDERLWVPQAKACVKRIGVLIVEMRLTG